MKDDLVSLRGMTGDDYDLLATWLDGPAGAYANGGPTYSTGHELQENARRNGYTYLMVVTDDGHQVGAVSWRTLSYPGNYSAGIVIGDPRLWARGYGAVATGLLFGHLFSDRNAHRVEIMTGVYNKETMKIVTRGLMTLEGVLRDYAFVDGEYHDVVVCSLLADEYQELVKHGKLLGHAGVIPAVDKAEALSTLLDHLANAGDIHLSRLLARRRERVRARKETADAGGPCLDRSPDGRVSQ